MLIEEFVESFLSHPESPPPFDERYMHRRRVQVPTFALPEMKAIPSNVKTLIVLDDNFYYKSMRRVFQQMSRRHQSCYGELVVTVPVSVALLRNSQRSGASRVPDDVLERMSNRFENIDNNIPGTFDISTATIPNDVDINRSNTSHTSHTSNTSNTFNTSNPFF